MKARLLGLVLGSLLVTVALAQDAPQVDKSGPAVPAAIGKPIETALHRAGSADIDLRKLPYRAPQKKERPELEEPEANPVVLPGGPSVSPGATPKSITVPSAPAPAPNITFDGLDNATWGAGHPPDTNGDVGPTYYIQTINSSIGVYRKSDGVRVAAFTFNTFMSQGAFGNLCDTDNFGDPVVLYDTFEDRWVLTDFAFKLDASNNVINPPGAFQCFAVSKTGDPVTGGWNFYSINTTGGLGDYPKFGIWPDGIYMSANMFGYAAGAAFQNPRVYALNKAQMYAGSPTVQVVTFNAPAAEFTLLPSNARLQAGTPPPGSPNYFGVVWQSLNAFSVYKFHVDWNHISTSSFTGPFTSFDTNFWEQLATANQTAPTPANRNDELYIRLMMQNQYSNIGGVESLWATHTVGAGNPGAVNATATQAAVRFYQVKVTGGTVEAAATQAWTYSPDASLWRYMPSIAVDRAGDMAIGYTTSNATNNPALKYAAQTAGVLNNIDQTEQALWQGTGAQSGTCGGTCTRWGDYSAMTLDPDGCTFWYTNEYYATTGLNHVTRIGSFTLPTCTPVGAGGTVSGTVTRTSDSTPIIGATVALGSRTTTTNGSGAYSFAPLPAGTYPTISASFPGCITGFANAIVVTDGGTTTQNFSLAAQNGSACLTDTSQADFQGGVLSQVDLAASPGDVALSKSDGLDQSNESVTTNGFGFTSTSWVGQTFKPTVSGPLVKADLDLFCSACTGTTPNLTVSIRATTGATPLPTGADLASATLAGFNSGSGGFFSVTFASPATVTAGTTYAVIIRATANPSAGTYAYVCSCTTNTNPYINGQRVTSTNSGGTWTADTTAGGRDLGFRIYVNPAYSLSGNFISSTKDANPAPGYVANWTTLSWDASTPANTAVKFQAAASNDANSAFSFVGPDGTPATFFTNGASLSQFSGNRYLQYRAFLTTTNNAATPLVNDVTVCYNDVAAAAASLAFGQQPSNTTAGTPVGPAITVRLLDSLGALAVADNTSQVTLSVASGPGTLSGGGPVTASGGIATFSSVSFTTAGTYTLTASSGALANATSTSFVVSASAASKLVFVQQPSDATAGAAISPAVTVQVQDAFGNVAISDTSAVTLAIGTNPGSGTLSGTATQNAVAGVATFNDLSIDKVGTGYTLTAADGALTGATSAAFNITSASAASLAFGVQPSNTTAGAAISPAITVRVLDTFGNIVAGDTSAVTLAIGTNPGSGTLSGTATQNAVAGVATFNNLSINKLGTGYTLTAADGALTGATSTAFNITAASAATLAFGVQPSNATAGTVISPAITVRVLDAFGNIVAGDTSAVTLAIGTNPGSGTLSGTTTQNAVAGVATFSNLSINKVGTGYTLTAGDGALSGAISSGFNITAASAASLAFGVQPSNATAGTAISPAITVRVVDAFGNTVAGNTSAVTLAIGTNPGSGTLSGTATQNAVAGVATFNNLSIDKVGTGYTLTAADGALTGATSTGFNITPASAASLSFNVQPNNTTAGVAISPAVTVRVLDTFGNIVVGNTSAVTLAVGTNPGGGTLSGTATQNAVAGVATFSNLWIDKVGTGYTLTAADGVLTGAISTGFNITPASAASLAFGVQPSNTTAGVAISPAITIRVLDAFGNLETGDNSSQVTVSVASGPGTLAGGGPATVSGGVATFSSIVLTTTGTYTVSATSGVLTSPSSASFVVSAGSGNKLVFGQQPSNATAGTAISPAITVQLQDQFGNALTTSGVAVTLTANGPGGITSGASANTSSGVATFAGTVIQTAGSYTLSAAASGYTSATSTAFTVSPATASKLVYGQQPSNATAGQSISPAIKVLVEDAFNNVVTSSSASVALVIGTNPGTSTLTGGGATPAVSGAATFNGVSLNKSGNGYTLIASSAGLTSATSTTFNVTAGVPAKLVYTTQPATNANVVAGAAINLVAQVQDANGNLVTSDTSAVTIAIGNNPGSSTLGGTTTVNAAGGIATFTGLGLSLNKVGTGYTLVASDSNGAVSNVTSNAFNITPAAANQLVFGQQPSDIAAGAIMTPAVSVRVLDTFGNQLASSVNVVTLSIATGPSATLLGGGSLNDSAGVATYNALTVQAAGVYTLSATATGLTSATSTAFTVSPAALHHLTFTTQPPSSTAAGAAFAVAVELRDQYQNVLSGNTGTTVSLALGANPGSDAFAGLSTSDTAGVATFSGVALTKAAAGYTLVASAGSKTGTSTTFAVTPGAFDHLAVSTQPAATVTAGAAFGVAAQLQDVYNNLLTTDSASTVTVALANNPGGDGYAGGSAQVSAGTATFTVTLTKPGTGYRLGFTSGANAVQTNSFAVVPATGATLAFVQQPADVSQGTPLGMVSVEVRDTFGNRVTADNASVVTLSLAACGGSISVGTATVASGVGTFAAPASTFNFYTVGSGLQLQATSAGLTSSASQTFAVVSNTGLVFTDGFDACRP